jgi:hypothetical protein
MIMGGLTLSTRGETPDIFGLVLVMLLRLSKVGASPVERGVGPGRGAPWGGENLGVRGGSALREG